MVSEPVLRSTPGGPHLPPGPLPLPVGERKGERGTERKNAGNSRAIVARARQVHDEKFLIRF